MQFWTVFFVIFIGAVTGFKLFITYLHIQKLTSPLSAKFTEYYNQDDYFRKQQEIKVAYRINNLRQFCSSAFIILAISLGWFGKIHGYIATLTASVLWQNTVFIMTCVLIYTLADRFFQCLLFKATQEHNNIKAPTLKSEILGALVQIIAIGVLGLVLSLLTQNFSSMIGLSIVMSVLLIWYRFIRLPAKNKKNFEIPENMGNHQTIDAYYQHDKGQDPSHIVGFLEKFGFSPQEVFIIDQAHEDIERMLCFSYRKRLFITKSAMEGFFTENEAFTLIAQMAHYTRVPLYGLRTFVLITGLLGLIFSAHFVLTLQPLSLMLGATANIPVLNLLVLAIFTVYLNILYLMFARQLDRQENLIADKQALVYVDKAPFIEAHKKLYGVQLLTAQANNWAASFLDSSMSLQQKLKHIEAAPERTKQG